MHPGIHGAVTVCSISPYGWVYAGQLSSEVRQPGVQPRVNGLRLTRGVPRLHSSSNAGHHQACQQLARGTAGQQRLPGVQPGQQRLRTARLPAGNRRPAAKQQQQQQQ
jgi:hypothetical protein